MKIAFFPLCHAILLHLLKTLRSNCKWWAFVRGCRQQKLSETLFRIVFFWVVYRCWILNVKRFVFSKHPFTYAATAQSEIMFISVFISSNSAVLFVSPFSVQISGSYPKTSYPTNQNTKPQTPTTNHNLKRANARIYTNPVRRSRVCGPIVFQTAWFQGGMNSYSPASCRKIMAADWNEPAYQRRVNEQDGNLNDFLPKLQTWAH